MCSCAQIWKKYSKVDSNFCIILLQGMKIMKVFHDQQSIYIFYYNAVCWVDNKLVVEGMIDMAKFDKVYKLLDITFYIKATYM